LSEGRLEVYAVAGGLFTTAILLASYFADKNSGEA
jgi:hypothetical protein